MMLLIRAFFVAILALLPLFSGLVGKEHSPKFDIKATDVIYDDNGIKIKCELTMDLKTDLVGKDNVNFYDGDVNIDELIAVLYLFQKEGGREIITIKQVLTLIYLIVSNPKVDGTKRLDPVDMNLLLTLIRNLRADRNGGPLDIELLLKLLNVSKQNVSHIADGEVNVNIFIDKLRLIETDEEGGNRYASQNVEVHDDPNVGTTPKPTGLKQLTVGATTVSPESPNWNDLMLNLRRYEENLPRMSDSLHDKVLDVAAQEEYKLYDILINRNQRQPKKNYNRYNCCFQSQNQSRCLEYRHPGGGDLFPSKNHEDPSLSYSYEDYEEGLWK